MEKVFFEKVAVIGVGLLGASFAKALKKGALCGSITGSGRTEANLIKAREMGIVDDYTTEPERACENADLVVFATPVGSSLGLAARVGLGMKGGALVIDVGSVKGKLVHEMQDIMPEGVHYVGCHPIAGGNRTGAASAREDLFAGALCIITETDKTDPDALALATRLWEAVGSRVKVMDPAEHDRVYALVSHIPHLVAYALVNSVADVEEEYLQFAGKGFKDSTRIAASSPELWRDISMANRENILGFIEVFKGNIDRLCLYLREPDSASLEKEFQRAKSLRERLENS